MQRNNAVPVVILVLLGCFAVWCLSSIIGRRFSAGDAYPPYSSLRSDPLGSRVLFESLDRLDGTQRSATTAASTSWKVAPVRPSCCCV
ncbi:hypothetical protein [Verrucomicrobium spinosum]|uniref:hypothetical protein n=1 Tax=Verrucomicrobium spinosum TaxID=2736 RepID=UPI000946345A|nr:hypothetical protein [Verrucomicrobium spinosum]